MHSVMSLHIGLLLVAVVIEALSVTVAMVSNPVFAGTGFRNKAECMEYVIDSTKVNRNLAAKLCAEY
jgi:hypothetical protein